MQQNQRIKLQKVKVPKVDKASSDTSCVIIIPTQWVQNHHTKSIYKIYNGPMPTINTLLKNRACSEVYYKYELQPI